MSASTADPGPPMPRGLPKNLLRFFTQALEDYKLSQTPFRVLCSLTPSSSSTSSSFHNELAPPAPPASQPRSLLVLDSSFNPPTLAHLRMALSAAASRSDPRSSASTSRVLLLLATSNADKAPKPALFPQRLAMMYIFAQDLLSATATESVVQDGRAGPVPAVDIGVTTEPYFHSKGRAVAESDFYKGGSSSSSEEQEDSDTGGTFEQVYLTGFDTLIRIFNPKYYPDNMMIAALDPFFARARLRVTMRTDAEWGDAEAQREYVERLRDGRLAGVGGRTEWAEKVEMVEGRREGEAVVSSTKVRDAVVGQDWDLLRTLVSERMIEWIRGEGLYSWDDR